MCNIQAIDAQPSGFVGMKFEYNLQIITSSAIKAASHGISVIYSMDHVL